MKYHNDSLILEITRFCNMTCPHCLRGDIQRKRMKKETITKVLENFEDDYIDTITFTGGEPSLAPDLMEYALNECKRLNISISNFWMATNGLNPTRKFFNIVKDWLEYCTDNELSGLRVSIDKYHDKINKYPFVNFQEELENDGLNCYFEYRGAGENLISEGRAYWNYGGKSLEQEIRLYPDNNNMIESPCYINVNGDLITTCDASYDTQEEKEYNLGNIHKESIESMYDRFFENNPEFVDKES